MSDTPFETAYYQLRRYILKTTTASFIIQLAVKLFLRQCYTFRCKRLLTNTVEVGGINLWQPSVASSGKQERFSIYVPGTVYKFSSFALRYWLPLLFSYR